jgi:hypothetical protein
VSSKGDFGKEIKKRGEIMAEDKSGLYITLIVGVVAVLALMMMYMGGGASLSASPTGAVVAYDANTADLIGASQARAARGTYGDNVYHIQRKMDDSADVGDGRDLAMTSTADRNAQCVRTKYADKSYEQKTFVSYCSGLACSIVGADGVTLESGVSCVNGRNADAGFDSRDNPAVGSQYGY